MIIKTITEKVRNKFNISIAEIGDNDVWQRTKLGLCIVTNNGRVANSILDNVINYIDNLNIAEILDNQIELINFNI